MDFTYPLVIKHGNGKWIIEIGDFPMNTSIHRGVSIAIFGYRRVKAKESTSACVWGPDLVFVAPESQTANG